MKKHKFYSLYHVIMMLSAYDLALDEFNPSGISTRTEWSTPAGYEKEVNDCYFDLVRIVYGQAEDTYLMVAEGGTDIWQDTNPDKVPAITRPTTLRYFECRRCFQRYVE